MKTTLTILFGGLAFILLIDTLLYWVLRKKLKRKAYIYLYWFHVLISVTGMLVYHFLIPAISNPEFYFWVGKAIAAFLLFYAPKTLYLLLYALALLFKLLRLKKVGRIFTQTAWIVALLLFLLIFYGISLGRYNYRVIEKQVAIHQLPPDFEGFRIVQLTDMHLGSLGESYPGIARLVEQVNALEPDIIVFTGDMVNNFASEILPWKDLLKTLTAPYGKFAVTGNHDYGDYTHWESGEKKKENLSHFFQYMEEMGFIMLNNSHIPLTLEQDTLWLCGVENWGNPPFKRYGDLAAALNGIEEKHPLILLTHDPMHWSEEVVHYPVDLTLSGHTHAMQIGITIGHFNWSPAVFFYPNYNGLYSNGEKQLYVSRGEGYVGFAGRIGQQPEITLITLTNHPVVK